MTTQPPILPEKILARVQRTGRLHGGSVLGVAAFFALISGMAGDRLGAITGLLVAGAGAIEHHGAMILGTGESRGVRWLVASQGFLFAAIAGYCVVRLAHFELPPIPDEIRPTLEAGASQLGLGLDEYLTAVYRLGLKVLLVVSVFYQGGLGLYYFTRRRAVAQALAGK